MSKGYAKTFLFRCIHFVVPNLDVLVGGAAFVVLTGICQSQRFNRAIMLRLLQSDSGISMSRVRTAHSVNTGQHLTPAT